MASHGREYRWILAWRSISSQYNSRRYKCRLIPSWSSNRLRLALMSCHHNPQQEQQWTAAALKYTNKTRSCKLLHSVHSVFGINVYQCLPHIATSDLNSVIATDKRQVRMKRTLMFGKSSRKTSQDNLWKHEMRSQLVLLQISAIYNLHHGKIRVENPSRPPCKRDGRIRRTLSDFAQKSCAGKTAKIRRTLIKFAHHLIVSLQFSAIRHIFRLMTRKGWKRDEKGRKQGFAKKSTHGLQYPWILEHLELSQLTNKLMPSPCSSSIMQLKHAQTSSHVLPPQSTAGTTMNSSCTQIHE